MPGPLVPAGLTPAPEVVPSVDLLPLLPLAPDEGPAVHVQDLCPGRDQAGREGGDGGASLHASVVRVAGMVDQRQGWVDGHTDLDNLVGAPRVFAGLKLGHLMRIVEHNSHEMMNKSRNEHLV